MTYDQSSSQNSGRSNQQNRTRSQQNDGQWNNDHSERERQEQFSRDNRTTREGTVEDAQGRGARNFPFDNRDQNVEQLSQQREPKRNFYDQSGFGQEGGGQGGSSGQRQTYGEYGSQRQNQNQGQANWNSGRAAMPSQGQFGFRDFEGDYRAQSENADRQQQGGYGSRGGTQYGSTNNTWNQDQYGNRQSGGMNSQSYGQPSGTSSTQSRAERRQGPKGYVRSDDRIKEDVSDQLSYAQGIDVSDVEVSVKSGEVTLTGTIPSRDDKYEIERVVEGVFGVTEIDNRLKVKKPGQGSTTEQSSGSGSSGSSSSTSGSVSGSNSSSGKHSNK